MKYMHMDIIKEFLVEREDKDKKKFTKRVLRQMYLYGLNKNQVIDFMNTENCQLCGKKCEVTVDHDHKTGKIRGFLCQPCNSALGMAKDNIELLQKMIDYLKERQ